MKEKIVKVEVEKRVFIAEDGTEFQTAQECVDYENGCVARRADAIVAKLPHFTYSPGIQRRGAPRCGSSYP